MQDHLQEQFNQPVFRLQIMTVELLSPTLKTQEIRIVIIISVSTLFLITYDIASLYFISSIIYDTKVFRQLINKLNSSVNVLLFFLPVVD